MQQQHLIQLTTADQFAANSTNAMHRIDVAFTSGQISNSTAYSFSVFVKANGYDKLHIRYGGYNADNHGRGYDLSDGTTFDGKFDGTGALGAVTSSSMIEYPNGWYRCSFTFTTASDAASGVANILYYVSNSHYKLCRRWNFWYVFLGCSNGSRCFPNLLHPHIRKHSDSWSDLAKITGTNFTDFYNQTEGSTVFVNQSTFKSVNYRNVYYGEIFKASK